MMDKQRTCSGRRSEAGFTLIELLIAMFISIILLAGLVYAFISVRTTFNSQTTLAQLQDDQRVAMSVLSHVVQEAGYFPTPQSQTGIKQFPISTDFKLAGQVVVGTGNGSTDSSPDVLTVRFAASPVGATTSDFILNCNGSANTSASNVTTFINRFTVNDSKDLTCAVDGGTPVALVGNVNSWSVRYGVDVNGDGSAYRYYNADSVPSAAWNQVVSVRLQLNFANPLAKQPGQPATIELARVVNLMNRG